MRSLVSVDGAARCQWICDEAVSSQPPDPEGRSERRRQSLRTALFISLLSIERQKRSGDRMQPCVTPVVVNIEKGKLASTLTRDVVSIDVTL